MLRRETYDTLIGLHCPCEDTPEDCECERTYCPCKGTDANGICLGKDEHGNPYRPPGNDALGLRARLVYWLWTAATGLYFWWQD